MDEFGTTYVREVFRYSDGQKSVCADPMRLKGELHIESFRRGIDIDKALTDIETGCKEDASEPERVAKWEAALGLAELIAVVFKVPYTEELGPDVTYNLSLLDYFYEYLEKKKSDARLASDLISIFGIAPELAFGHPIVYDDICGLILNLDRATSRMTYAVARGTAIAHGAPVSAWLYDGVAASAQEAVERAFRETCRRNERKAMAMAKLGPAGFVMGAKR